MFMIVTKFYTVMFIAGCHVAAKFIVVVYTSYCFGGLQLGLYQDQKGLCVVFSYIPLLGANISL